MLPSGAALCKLPVCGMALRASTDSILLTSLGYRLHNFSHGEASLDRGHHASDTRNTAEKVACHRRTRLHMRTHQCDSVLFGLFNTRDKQVGTFRGFCDLSPGF